MSIQTPDIQAIRTVLSEQDPKSSASAATPLPTEELYMPAAHANALDPSRPLVVGNRGVGKSVWSGALADEKTRKAIASSYPRLGLDRLTVRLGFHQDAGRVPGVAPSSRVLASLLSQNVEAEEIWTAVLLRAVAAEANIPLPDSLGDTVAWVSGNVERAEAALRTADSHFRTRNLQFMLVFDALDRLASSWEKIRPLTEGILRLALNMDGYRAMCAKVFMRTDQAKDEKVLFRFPDASKMLAARVELAWHATELYGLLFGILRRSDQAGEAFGRVVKTALGRIENTTDIEDPAQQMAVFKYLAGEFMGSDHRRGRTYTWVIDHLADAFHETTPRSFPITLQRAATARSKPVATVIDHYGIREGVQQASEVRVSQLQEDYPWIRTVLEHLEGLEVPCAPNMFTGRWRDRQTVETITAITKESERPGPIELEQPGTDPQEALLGALKNIGVIEERSEDRINMPDIFRVAAKIKRRGGVRPPVTGSRRS